MCGGQRFRVGAAGTVSVERDRLPVLQLNAAAGTAHVLKGRAYPALGFHYLGSTVYPCARSACRYGAIVIGLPNFVGREPMPGDQFLSVLSQFTSTIQDNFTGSCRRHFGSSTAREAPSGAFGHDCATDAQPATNNACYQLPRRTIARLSGAFRRRTAKTT
ncbi:hypothetical protein ASE90_05160 [Sphingomonas sp. Leaf67]|nr:hypothetical protein ASE90_05160 [Sphingomonas sp. Leaf67]